MRQRLLLPITRIVHNRGITHSALQDKVRVKSNQGTGGLPPGFHTLIPLKGLATVPQPDTLPVYAQMLKFLGVHGQLYAVLQRNVSDELQGSCCLSELFNST